MSTALERMQRLGYTASAPELRDIEGLRVPGMSDPVGVRVIFAGEGLRSVGHIVPMERHHFADWDVDALVVEQAARMALALRASQEEEARRV